MEEGVALEGGVSGGGMEVVEVVSSRRRSRGSRRVEDARRRGGGDARPRSGGVVCVVVHDHHRGRPLSTARGSVSKLCDLDRRPRRFPKRACKAPIASANAHPADAATLFRAWPVALVAKQTARCGAAGDGGSSAQSVRCL